VEAQLLNIVVQKERPDLDKQKNELVVKVGCCNPEPQALNPKT